MRVQRLTRRSGTSPGGGRELRTTCCVEGFFEFYNGDGPGYAVEDARGRRRAHAFVGTAPLLRGKRMRLQYGSHASRTTLSRRGDGKASILRLGFAGKLTEEREERIAS